MAYMLAITNVKTAFELAGEEEPGLQLVADLLGEPTRLEELIDKIRPAGAATGSSHNATETIRWYEKDWNAPSSGLQTSMAEAHRRAAQRGGRLRRRRRENTGKRRPKTPRTLMFRRIETANIGPAERLVLEVGRGTTLITGDNATGKTLLLDCIWAALTGSWPAEANPAIGPRLPAAPRDPAATGTIEAGYGKDERAERLRTVYDPQSGEWTPAARRHDGIVVYALDNGSVGVWAGGSGHAAAQRTHVLTNAEVWAGERQGRNDLPDRIGDARTAAEIAYACEPAGAERLDRAVATLLPETAAGSDGGRGAALRAIAQAESGNGAGTRRLTALAVLMAQAVAIAGQKARETGITLLIDDVEKHLHPAWQREVLDRLRRLADNAFDGTTVQIVAITKSPLVMASAEPWFDPQVDRAYHTRIDPERREAVCERVPFTLRGTAGNWLTSTFFGLKTDRGSVEAEQAVLEAKKLLETHSTDKERLREANRRLRAVLGDVDPFWVRWIAHCEQILGQNQV